MTMSRSAVVVAGLFVFGNVLQCSPAAAQQNPGYFIPPSPPAPSGPRTTAPRAPAPRPAGPPAVQVTPPSGLPGGGGNSQNDPPPLQVQLPPVPDLPALARGAAPPAAVIGVLGIPDIMHASTAAQQVEKLIGERREKLNEDAQKEQVAWRDLQQALANQRASLNADQIRTKERELQERITNSRANRAHADRHDPAGGREPGHEPRAAPGPGGVEHQRVRHYGAGRRADQQDPAQRRPAAGRRIGCRSPGSAAGAGRTCRSACSGTGASARPARACRSASLGHASGRHCGGG
jgi:hypothetical protein